MCSEKNSLLTGSPRCSKDKFVTGNSFPGCGLLFGSPFLILTLKLPYFGSVLSRNSLEP